MKPVARKTAGWTLIELLVLIAFVAIVFSLIPCAPSHNKARARRVHCASNLKQVTLSLRIFANEQDGRFPWMLSTNQGGSMELTNSAAVFEHLRAASNEMVFPKILACRADDARTWTTNFAQFSNTNLSYFISLDGRPHETNFQSILAGDRNILGGTAVNSSLRVVRKSDKLAWSKAIHQKAGNVALVDGSVLQVDDVGLNNTIIVMTNAAIRLAIP